MVIKLPWKRQLVVKVSWQIFAGFFIGLVASMTMVISLVLRKVEAIQPWLFEIVLGIAGLGFVLLVIGYQLQRRAEKKGPPAGSKPREDESSHPLDFFLKFEFWGAILLLGAGPIYLFARIANPPKPPPPPPAAVVVRKPPVPPVETNKPAPPRPEFPELTLEGFVYNGPRSTAVINGKTVQIGDTLSGVTIVSIEPEGVTVELQGERRVLKLEE